MKTTDDIRSSAKLGDEGEVFCCCKCGALCFGDVWCDQCLEEAEEENDAIGPLFVTGPEADES